jgi:hypothetical protein
MTLRGIVRFQSASTERLLAGGDGLSGKPKSPPERAFARSARQVFEPATSRL